jgi:ribonuclease P protein component
MLSAESRLRKKRDFQMVLKKGKSVSQEFFLLKFGTNGLAESRFGFLLSKKSFKKAWLRNRVKRVVSEIVRQNLKEIKKGIDMVIIPRPGIEKESTEQVKKRLFFLFQKANLIS